MHTILLSQKEIHGKSSLMAGKANPYKKEPGYYSARKVKTPVGGYLVIYDATKAPGLDSPERWVIWHHPSNLATCEPTQRKAIAYIEHHSQHGGGILEDLETAPPPKKEKPKAKSRGKKKGAPAPPDPLNVIDAHFDVVVQGQENVDPGSPHTPTHARSADPGMLDNALLQSLEAQFPWLKLMDKLEELLNAKRKYVTKDGDEREMDDYSTQLKALEMVFKYKIGSPRQRQEVTVNKELDIQELLAMAQQSPMFAKALRKIFELLPPPPKTA